MNPRGATHLCHGGFADHLFKGLWHAPIHEALAVLVGLSKSWRRDGWRVHKVFSKTKETGCRRVNEPLRVSKTTQRKNTFHCDHVLTVPGEAGGRDQTLAQRLLSLVRDGPVVGENPTLQLVQVSGGKLHAAPGAVPILIIAPLEIHTWKESQRVTQFIWSGPCRCLLHVFIFLSIYFLSSSEVCVCVCIWQNRTGRSRA